MTKAEVIRKTAKRAGVPDSEAKVFFEIFLEKSSELLKPGEAILLKGLGHFQFRKGKVRSNIPTKPAENESALINLMVYYPVSSAAINPSSDIHGKDAEEEIIFNVPVLQLENYNPLDSHFSLSLGKPVIPLKDVSTTDFFIPLTGMELRKLVEAKVDKLLSDAELVKEYTKGNEVLIINTGFAKSHQLEFKWSEKPSKNIADKESAAQSQNAETGYEELPAKEISWDFGDDLSKEIEEESILDTDREEQFITDEETGGQNINWNFGVTVVDEEPHQAEPEIGNEEKLSEEENQPSQEEQTVSAEIPGVQQSVTEDISLWDDIETENKFERVRSFSSYFDDDKTEMIPGENELDTLGKPETASFQKFEPDTQINEENIQDEVLHNEADQTLITEQEKQPDEIKDLRQQISDDEIDTTSTAIEETPEADSKAGNEKVPEQLSSDSIEKPYIRSSVITKRLENKSYYSREGTSPVFLIAVFVIIAVAVALYFYLNKTFDFSKKKPAEEVTQSTIIHPNIIERDYSIPVTYPYNIEQSGIQSEGAGTKIFDGSISPKALDEIKSQEIKKIGQKKNEVEKTGGRVNKIQQQKENTKAEALTKEKQKVNNGTTDASAFSFDKLPPPADTTKLHENISTAGGNYTVQVSSWHTKSIADQQAAKFKSKGYDAYVEKAVIPGKGTWYRVKVKNFKTMREAENFLMSNQ